MDWMAGIGIFFSLSLCQDWLWGPPSLFSSGYRGCFPRGKAAGAWSWPFISI